MKSTLGPSDETFGRAVGGRDWIVQLEGPEEALSYLSTVLANGTITVRKKGSDYYFYSDGFSSLTDAHDVENRARRILSEASALLNLYLAFPARITPACAYWVDSSGRSHGIIGGSVYATVRTITPEGIALLGETDTRVGLTLASRLLSISSSDPIVRKILAVVGANDPTWTDLYVLLELIGKKPYLKKHRYAPPSILDRLFQTANYYRHGRGVTLPDPPFEINAARALVRQFVARWLGEHVAQD